MQKATYELFKVVGIKRDEFINSSLNYEIRVLETFKKTALKYPKDKYIVIKDTEKSAITFDLEETYAALFYTFSYLWEFERDHPN